MSNSDEKIMIKCLDGFTIFFKGENLALKMRSEKAKELIAFLLVNNGKARTSNICEALWPNSNFNLKVELLYKLIKKISNAEFPFRFNLHRSVIEINTDNIECDLFTFDQLCSKYDSIECMERIVQICKTPLFDTEYYDWTYERQGHYNMVYLRALEKVCSYYEKNNNQEKENFYKNLLHNLSV